MTTPSAKAVASPERFVPLTGKHIHDRGTNSMLEVTTAAKTYAEQQAYLRELCALLNHDECRWEEVDVDVYQTCSPSARFHLTRGMELPAFCSQCGKPVVGVDPHE